MDDLMYVMSEFIYFMKKVVYFFVVLILLSACQKKADNLRSTLNPEIMNFVKKYNDILVREDLLQKKRYAICVHVENRFDTVKVYVTPIVNFNDMLKIGNPTFEDSVGKRKVYIYVPQLQYLYSNMQKVKLDSFYFSKIDTLTGCMIPSLILKRFGKDSTVKYTELYDSPIMRTLLPPPPPREIKFIPPTID